jgi:succinoglycan biosynthesis transport protein ExoP
MEASPGGAFAGSLTDRELDLRYYAGLLWRRRALIAAVTLVGLALALVVAYIQTPEYQASALLQIEPPTPSFMTVNEALVSMGGYWQNADFYNTQFKVLTSGGLGGKVVDRLKLRDRPPFKDSPDPGVLFMKQVSVNPVPESRLVYVSVTHRDPKEAALWANALVQTFTEASLEGRVEAARRAYDWLQERLSLTQRGMQQAQEKLFRGLAGQEAGPSVGEDTGGSIAKLNEDFLAAQSRRIGIEAALKQLAAMRAANQPIDAVPQVATDSIVVGLNAQISGLGIELGRLREKFKEAHPEVQRVKGQVDQLEKAKALRAAQIEMGLKAELAQIQKQESELSGAMDKQRAQAALRGQKATEIEILKKEAGSAASLYDILLQKLNETDIAASIRSNNVSVVEQASPPSSPVRPNKKRIAGMGLFLGLLLGVGLVLARDYLANTIRDPEEVERFLHLDLLGAVPKYESEDAHSVTEAYQNLRTALVFARRDDRGQIVLVTGTAPQEGKTTTLLNLARLLAASGESTIAVDGDLRRAQVHQRLGLPREPGFTDYFVHHTPLDALIRPSKIPNLSALTAGPLPPNPPAVLTRRDFPQFIEELKARFDWVLVDSPPLASVTDALLLARQADQVILVVQYNKVDKKLIKRQVAALRKATANVLGVVLNAVDTRAERYSYYYAYDYHPEDGSKVAAPARGRARARRR